MNAFSRTSILCRTGRLCASWIFAATLSLLLVAPASTAPASAQTANNLLSQTPLHVRDGKATLAQHYDGNKMLRLSIALTPPHMDQERQLLDELHDKKSPQFHKFLSPEEWDNRFAPSAEDEQAVVDWAKAQGFTINHRFADRLLVDVEAPASVIEKAFDVTINSYTMNGDTYFSNDRDPSIPSSLKHTIQAVIGMNSFLRLHPAIAGAKPGPMRPDYIPGPSVAVQPEMKVAGSKDKLAAAMKKKHALGKVAAATSTDGSVKPDITNGNYDPTDIYSSDAYDWNALDNLGHCCNPNNGTVSPPEATIDIAAFGDVDYNDIYAFHDQYGYLAENFQKVWIDGTYACNNNPNANPPYDDNCLEVTLDTEWSIAMSNDFGAAADTAKVWIYEGASYGDIADVYNFMVSDGYSKVTSTSWGCEEFACFDGPTMSSLDGIFSKMVGQGWTLIAASGDKGATAGCDDQIDVQFPSSDPNFVGVGGTSLYLDSGPVYDEEVGWTGGTYSTACAKNNGGSTGGFSGYFGSPSYQSSFGYANRSIPDIALNSSQFQNMYFALAGGLIGVGGTSIAAPEMAGFFAQENAYALSLGDVCGSGSSPCAPIGNANYYLYTEGVSQNAPHYPFYDITSGCNSNNITAEYSLNAYCAATGLDQVTGWGSANMLQLAWSINWNDATANGGPSITFGGPATYTWYNTDQFLDWDVNDNVGNRGGSGTGIAGYTQGWDSIPGDVYAESTPGDGNSFYSGPQHANSSFGCTDLDGSLCTGGPVSQGCHTLYVEGWNNMGVNSGVQSYGPICYDTIAPVATSTVTGTLNGLIYTSGVTVHLYATDSGSGVSAIYYQVDSGSPLTYSSPFSITTTGSHVVSYYAVDVAGNNSPVTYAGINIESPTSTKVAASINPTTYGDSVTLTATVGATFGGLPTGTVTFRAGAAIVGSATLSSGKATLATTSLPAGSYSVTAQYTGDSFDEASTSGAISETVKQATSSTTLTSSADPSTYDEPVTFTATVKSGTTGTPAGTVTFRKDGTSMGTAALSGGKAVLTVSNLTLGAHSITASYGGNSDFLTSASAALKQMVDQTKTTTSLTSSLNPSLYEDHYSFTVIVKSVASGTPTGSVTLKNGSTTVGTASLSSGKAVFNVISSEIGTFSFTAVYGGNTDFAASTSPVHKQVMEKAGTKTTIASSLNPSTFDKSVTFTAEVKSTTSGTPTGTVTFKNGGSTIGAATLSSGKAVFSTSSLSVGSHSITAEYNGNTDYDASTSSGLTEKVEQAATATKLASSLNPSTSGKAVTFTATVTSSAGEPTGTVTFTSGGAKIGTGTLSGGEAKFTTSSLSTGSHAIQAVYGGATDYLTSKSADLSQKVNP